MKTRRHRAPLILAVLLLVVLASCVSRKKYQAAQQDLNQQREISQNYRLRIDSLQTTVVVLNDSIALLDSLLNIEKTKLATARRGNSPKSAGGTIKKSSLTREEEASKKSVFMLTFARNVIWPKTFLPGSNLIIGVIDDQNLFYDQLKRTMEGKTVGGKPIQIKKFTVFNITPAHILYISHDQIGNFAKVKTAVKSDPTLLVTEEGPSGYANSHINYYVNDTKVQYSLNRTLLDKNGLKITQDLIKYAD